MTALVRRLPVGLLVKKAFISAALISATMLTLTGCGSSGPGRTSATTTTSTASWSRPDAPPDPHTLLRAGAAAVTNVPGGTVTFIESETDDAGTWKVRVVTRDGIQQELKLGTDGLTVLVGPTPTNDGAADRAERLASVQAAKLDYRAAVDKVLAAVPDGSITELSLEGKDGGGAVWDAEVWDTDLVEHQVTIDAVSGALIADRQV